jgi:hypothetical protein
LAVKISSKLFDVEEIWRAKVSVAALARWQDTAFTQGLYPGYARLYRP